MKLHVLKIVYILYAYVVSQLTSLELKNLDGISCAINFQTSEGTFPSVIAYENSRSVWQIHRLIPSPNIYFQETVRVSHFSCLNLLFGTSLL